MNLISLGYLLNIPRFARCYAHKPCKTAPRERCRSKDLTESVNRAVFRSSDSHLLLKHSYPGTTKVFLLFFSGFSVIPELAFAI